MITVPMLLIVLILFGAATTVFGCSLDPTSPIGPFIRGPFLFPTDSFLYTTTGANADLVAATLELYSDEDQQTPVSSTDITIDAKAGAVTQGHPAGDLTTPPEPVVDPTGGWQLNHQSGSMTATFTKPASNDITVELLVSDGYVLYESDDLFGDRNPVYFFFSEATERIYLLYDTKLDCSLEVNRMEDRCIDCPTCTYPMARAAIVDPSAVVATIYSDFRATRDVYVSDPGPFNSLPRVYDSIQIAQMGFFDSCGGAAYYFYDATTFTDAALQIEFLTALKYGDKPEDLMAFDLNQEVEYVQDDTTFGTKYVTKSTLVQTPVVPDSGRLPTSIELNRNDILWLVNDFLAIC